MLKITADGREKRITEIQAIIGLIIRILICATVTGVVSIGGMLYFYKSEAEKPKLFLFPIFAAAFLTLILILIIYIIRNYDLIDNKTRKIRNEEENIDNIMPSDQEDMQQTYAETMPGNSFTVQIDLTRFPLIKIACIILAVWFVWLGAKNLYDLFTNVYAWEAYEPTSAVITKIDEKRKYHYDNDGDVSYISYTYYIDYEYEYRNAVYSSSCKTKTSHAKNGIITVYVNPNDPSKCKYIPDLIQLLNCGYMGVVSVIVLIVIYFQIVYKKLGIRNEEFVMRNA